MMFSSFEDSNRLSNGSIPQIGRCSFEVRGSQTDFQNQLQLSSLFEMMQDAAYKNAQALGSGADVLDPLDLCWLLSKMSVRLCRSVRWQDKLVVFTWSRGPRRILFLRDYVIYVESKGTLLLTGLASSEWFLADRARHRPVRPELVDCLRGFESHRESPAALAAGCPRLNSSACTKMTEGILQTQAGYSDIDRNGHVNNTRYAAWAVDALHAAATVQNKACELRKISINGMDIQYISEIAFGSRVDLHVAEAVDIVEMEENTTDSQPVVSSLLVEGRHGPAMQTAFRSRIFYHETNKGFTRF